MVKITERDVKESSTQAPNGDVEFLWLGQAGFLFAFENCRFMIDPYLSDFLAKKYAGAEFDHVRMMPAPIRAEEVTNLDGVLCTHRHSDHVDPETLGTLGANNPQCTVIAPAAERDHICDIVAAADSVIGINDGESIGFVGQIVVEAVASAHEQIEINERGEHRFLGFIIRMGDIVIYHSGDCVPYEGLFEKLTGKQIDVAFLPVNGRDDYRRDRNIAGNFTFEESLELCNQLDIPLMVCHHFGMFDFNTIEPQVLREKIERAGVTDRVTVPEIDRRYVISK